MVSLSDPLADLLTRIRNAQHARRSECRAPWSRIKEQLCAVLKREGWIADARREGEAPKQEILVVFSGEHPKLNLERVSRPGRRVYKTVEELRPVLNGFGMAVITTSKGLLTDKEARARKIGGELLCTIC